ncbi:TPA: hypothetical protein ACSTLY_002578 [Serratia fonticola]|uniref:hypothetical protein n=1 Tax=Serratia fonticola TaxID=47917 RepID=UPI002179C7EF|nr:hypothetical protein [Serratia fonticola]CAI1113452.1 Uncharacterised protein [Serratia fonticola]CAI1135836.1 Uncharacterised protein [Serratia fonticola]CAI1922493.1 Uncharacterised protein [Serratia fonticola]CAI1925555.1 Uncharacterised protein [Serratia fonticola]
MKKIIFALLAIILICSYLFYRHHFTVPSKQPFRCDAQLISHIERHNKNIDINLFSSIIFTIRGEGLLEMTGTYTQDNQQYLVNRKVFFTHKHSELNGMKKTTISREVVTPSDNVPEESWQQYILPDLPGVEFYTELKEMNKNAVFFQGLSNPFFVCVLSEYHD